MDSGLFGALCVLLGVLVTHGVVIYNSRLERESAERRHRREWAITAAIENWKTETEFCKWMADNGAVAAAPPLEHYILSMLALVDTLPKAVTEANTKTILASIRKISAVARADRQDWIRQLKQEEDGKTA